MSSLSFFPLIPAVTTASAAPVYHGGMISCLGDVEPVNTRWLVKGYFPMGAVSVVAGPGGVGKGVFLWRMWWLPMDESITYVTQEKLNVGTKARSILFHTQTVGVKNKAGAEVETVRAVRRVCGEVA